VPERRDCVQRDISSKLSPKEDKQVVSNRQKSPKVDQTRTESDLKYANVIKKWAKVVAKRAPIESLLIGSAVGFDPPGHSRPSIVL